MFRLKVKKQDEQAISFNFRTFQEVAGHMGKFCDIEALKQMLADKKETNIRFYIKEIK